MVYLKNKRIFPEGIYLSHIEKALFILSNPSWIPFVYMWLKSLNKGSSTELSIPWFTFKTINWLDKYLSKKMVVFEYGSGGSTIYLSNRVKFLYSVEHDDDWFKQVRRSLIKKNIKNVKINLKKPELNRNKKNNKYSSTTFEKYLKSNFKKYVTYIDNFPNNFFDLIIIDGRARSACIEHSVKKVKKNGYILLDNSERLSYQPAVKMLSRYKRTDFFGFGPTLETFWQTSIWKK